MCVSRLQLQMDNFTKLNRQSFQVNLVWLLIIIIGNLLQTSAMAIRNNLNWHFIPDQFCQREKDREDFLDSDRDDRKNCAEVQNPSLTRANIKSCPLYHVMSIPKGPGETMTHNLFCLLGDMIPGKEEEKDTDVRVQGEGIPLQAGTDGEECMESVDSTAPVGSRKSLCSRGNVLCWLELIMLGSSMHTWTPIHLTITTLAKWAETRAYTPPDDPTTGAVISVTDTARDPVSMTRRAPNDTKRHVLLIKTANMGKLYIWHTCVWVHSSTFCGSVSVNLKYWSKLNAVCNPGFLLDCFKPASV